MNYGPPFPGPPIRRTAQNFALFFPSSHFHSFFPLLGVFSWNFGGVFEGWGPEMFTFGLSGCRVKPRRGFTRQPENSKRAQLSVRRFKHHQNSTRRPTERRKNEISGGREKKARNFRPHFFWVRAPPLRPHPFRAPTPSQKKLAKWGLAKFGQQILAKFDQINFGQMWYWPNSAATGATGAVRVWGWRPKNLEDTNHTSRTTHNNTQQTQRLGTVSSKLG